MTNTDNLHSSTQTTLNSLLAGVDAEILLQQRQVDKKNEQALQNALLRLNPSQITNPLDVPANQAPLSGDALGVLAGVLVLFGAYMTATIGVGFAPLFFLFAGMLFGGLAVLTQREYRLAEQQYQSRKKTATSKYVFAHNSIDFCTLKDIQLTAAPRMAGGSTYLDITQTTTTVHSSLPFAQGASSSHQETDEKEVGCVVLSSDSSAQSVDEQEVVLKQVERINAQFKSALAQNKASESGHFMNRARNLRSQRLQQLKNENAPFDEDEMATINAGLIQELEVQAEYRQKQEQDVLREQTAQDR